MNMNTVSALALVASLGLALPAMAQTDQQQPTGEQTEQNAPQAPDSTMQDSAQESPDTSVQAPADDASSVEQSATTETKTDMDSVASTADGQIVLQEDGTFLATDFVGTTVYSSGEESLGEVKDLIFAEEGTLQGVVIGVGGFLGIGEKQVAFTMDRLNMTENDDGIRLTIDATSEELTDAEAFKSKQTQKVEADAERARQEQESSATGAATPNPASPPSQPQ